MILKHIQITQVTQRALMRLINSEVTLITSSTPAVSAAALFTFEAATATTGRLLRIATTTPTSCICVARMSTQVLKAPISTTEGLSDVWWVPRCPAPHSGVSPQDKKSRNYCPFMVSPPRARQPGMVIWAIFDHV